MAYRDDVTALAARHAALAGELADKTRELEESSQLLEQARARARQPVLDQIRVASPCTADWGQMTGDHQVRHCGECRKDVYNLSGMTRDEAEAVIREHNGELCVRYYQRHDGTILLDDCIVGVDRLRRRKKTAARAAALVAGGLAVAGATAAVQLYQNIAPCQLPHDRDGSLVMGQAMPIPPPAPEVPPAPPAPPAADELEHRFARPPETPEQKLVQLRKQHQTAPEPGQFLMGVVRAPTRDAPPAQPDAKPARHPAGAAGKRAR